MKKPKLSDKMLRPKLEDKEQPTIYDQLKSAVEQKKKREKK